MCSVRSKVYSLSVMKIRALLYFNLGIVSLYIFVCIIFYVTNEPNNSRLELLRKKHKTHIVNPEKIEASTNKEIRNIIENESIINQQMVTLRKDLVSHNVLFNNRVNKAGSTTLLMLMERLARSNNYLVYRRGPPKVRSFSANQKALLANKLCAPEAPPSVFSRHMFYTDLEGYGCSPLHINMVRDPVERFISRYYFKRSVFRFIHGLSTTPPIPGFDRKERRLALGNYTVPDTVMLEIDRTIEHCVQDGIQECHYNGTVSPANQLDPSIQELDANLTKNDITDNFSYNMDSQVVFFCGDSPSCRRLGNPTALRTAMDNIERKFPVVGTVELLDKMLVVLQCKLPTYFKGVVDLHEEDKERKKPVANQNVNRPRVDEETKRELKRRMEQEYKLYEFITDRLNRQYRECTTSN